MLFSFGNLRKKCLHSLRIAHNFHFLSSCCCLSRHSHAKHRRKQKSKVNQQFHATKWKEMSQNEMETTVINLPSITCNLLNGINVRMRSVSEYTEKKRENVLQHAQNTAIFIGTIRRKMKRKKKWIYNCVQLPSIEGNSTSHSILKQPHETRNNSVSTAMILIWKYFE